MVLTSDLVVDGAKFNPESIPQAQHDFNKMMEQQTREGGRWYEVGAAAYRKLREEGKTPIPARTVLPEGVNIGIPSRDVGREIPARVFLPRDGSTPVATFMHIHGGGWVLQSELDFDGHLRHVAAGAGSGFPMACISIGYRLAPEHPFPAALHDVEDAAEWLAANASKDPRLGNAPLAYISGESAGGQLTMVAALHLLQGLAQPYTGLKALVLHFGCYSLEPLPQATYFDEELVLTRDIMQAYRDALTPEELRGDISWLRSPTNSPLYADLRPLRGRLPPALFTCGTSDVLLDDTVFMAAKWQAAGAPKTYTKIFPGAPHGYIFFPPERSPASAEGQQAVADFLTLINSS